MAENFLRQSPLAHLGLEGRTTLPRSETGVAMAERPYPCIVNLRGKPDDKLFTAAAKKALGVDLPKAPNSTAGEAGLTALWLSPEEWWVIADDGDRLQVEGALAGRLRDALAGVHCAVTEVGESRTRIRVSGPRARDLLAKGCPLDLHPQAFGEAGRCAQTHIAKALVVLHLVADDPEGACFDIYALRSFSEYLWCWLEDAAQEYGLAVVSA